MKKIYKIIQKKIIIISVLLWLFLPAGQLFAQSAPALPLRNVSEPPNNCTDIKVGSTCGIDMDRDGTDDLECTNNGPSTDPLKITMPCRSLKMKSSGGSQFIESPGIGNYIAATYKYAVALISVLATIMIIIAGVIWTTSAGNPEKINSAKAMIARSLTGLILALGSYTLLYTINPDLVKFNSLQIVKIDKFIAEIPEDYTMPEGTPSDLPGLVSLDGIANVTFAPKKDRRAAREAKEALITAMQQFRGYKSGDVIINYGIRTPAQQYELLTTLCGCKPLKELLLPKLKEQKITKVTGKGGDGAGKWQDYCAKNLANDCQASSNSLTLEITDDAPIFKAPLFSHFGGKALDIQVTNGSYQPCGGKLSNEQEQKSKGVPNAGRAKGDVCIPKKQQKLIRAMLDNGFCVGLKAGSGLREPWHFEIAGGASTFCTSDKTDANLQKLYYFQNPEKE